MYKWLAIYHIYHPTQIYFNTKFANNPASMPKEIRRILAKTRRVPTWSKNSEPRWPPLEKLPVPVAQRESIAKPEDITGHARIILTHALVHRLSYSKLESETLGQRNCLQKRPTSASERK